MLEVLFAQIQCSNAASLSRLSVIPTLCRLAAGKPEGRTTEFMKHSDRKQLFIEVQIVIVLTLI